MLGRVWKASYLWRAGSKRQRCVAVTGSKGFSSLGESGAETKTVVSTKNSWGRMTHKLQADLDGKDETYLEGVKDAVDVESSLLSLQQEVQEEMAAALGRTGSQLTNAINVANEAHSEFRMVSDRYDRCVEKGQEPGVELKTELLEYARNFNRLRKCAETARIDLIVHRQAVGFSFNNYKIVLDSFPLPEAITRRVFRERYFDFDEFEKNTVKH
mmetsp:Transcript_974/g.1553  ORF Transcript_974/g.1553 Transcript_974/m.1553 type:complete len:214 (+) Transcript_974:229-870(+)